MDDLKKTDSNAANSSARRNATPNLQIAEVLHRRAGFVAQECITTRQLRVSTDGNVLGDPLSRGPKYMNTFREEAIKMGATSFVRMEVPELSLCQCLSSWRLSTLMCCRRNRNRERSGKARRVAPADHLAQVNANHLPSGYARSAR